MAITVRKLRIFRKTLVGDTFATLAASEKLEFNGNGQDNTVANGWTTRIHKGLPRAQAQHPNPNEDLSEQQDTGQDEDVYTIDFVISRADLVVNVFMDNLVDWNDNSQESLALPFGRFSIELDRAPSLNVDADATDGLEIRSIDYDMDEEVQNALTGTIVLSRGKAAS